MQEVEDAQWPLEYAERLRVGNTDSPVAACCLWAKQDQICRTLSPEFYSVLGNLYSRHGVNPLLRNLLANPRIRYLVVFARSLTDSGDALVNLFRHGVDGSRRIVGNGGVIDDNIPLDALHQLRATVELVDLRGDGEPAAEIRRLSSLKSDAAPRKALWLRPPPPPEVETYPNEEQGFVLSGETIIDVWTQSLALTMRFGQVTPTDHGIPQRELRGLQTVIRRPLPDLGPIPPWAPFHVRDVENTIRRFMEPNPEIDLPHSLAYRLQSHWGDDQIQVAVRELQRARATRRAVLSVWDPRCDSGSTSSPVITTIQYAVRNDRLCMQAYIRSNDMYRAYALDAAALAAIQAQTAEALDCPVGVLSILSFSAHIFADSWRACSAGLASEDRVRRFIQDPRGNWVFSRDSGGFVAELYSPQGDLLLSRRTSSAKELEPIVLAHVSRTDHALYLGKELQRLAASEGRSYEQDKV